MTREELEAELDLMLSSDAISSYVMKNDQFDFELAWTDLVVVLAVVVV